MTGPGNAGRRAQGKGHRAKGAECLSAKGTEKRILNEGYWHEVCGNIFIIH